MLVYCLTRFRRFLWRSINCYNETLPLRVSLKFLYSLTTERQSFICFLLGFITVKLLGWNLLIAFVTQNGFLGQCLWFTHFLEQVRWEMFNVLSFAFPKSNTGARARRHCFLQQRQSTKVKTVNFILTLFLLKTETHICFVYETFLQCLNHLNQCLNHITFWRTLKGKPHNKLKLLRTYIHKQVAVRYMRAGICHMSNVSW